MSDTSSLLLAMARLPWQMGRIAAGAVSAALPGDPAWRELDHRLEAFDRFQSAGTDARRERARVDSLDAWSGIWSMEGLGYRLGLSGRPLPLDQLPERAWIPLHTGMGLALATRAVQGDEPPLRALRAFAARCRELSQPGLAGAAFEGLGLAARTLAPHRVPAFGRAVEALDEELTGELDGEPEDGPAARFWHGLGRALFFVPATAMPWGDPPGRALEKARREPPHELGRRNAVAGLGWAMTLVDLRSPELLDRFLGRHAGELPPDGAFSHGVAAAALVWARWTGRRSGDPLLDGLLAHPAANPVLWDHHVRRPCEEALDRLLPDLERSGRWQELFRL